MNRPSMLRHASEAALQLTLPLFETLLPRSLVEPRPGRRLVLLERLVVDYELRRSRRRTIGFTVDDRGLTVTAPRWVSQSDIEEALQEKSQWIRRKLVEWRDYAARRSRLEITWADGAELPHLGRTLRLQVQRAAGARAQVRADGDTLVVSLPDGTGREADADLIRNAVQAWVQQQARVLFQQRLTHYGELLGRHPTRWGLSSARTRWGSCGPDGAIRLNWRLMYFPPAIVDYVIAHELAHLRELNHSARFWAIVAQIYPRYREARAWLRSYPDDITIG